MQLNNKFSWDLVGNIHGLIYSLFQTDSGPCTFNIGEVGSGNYVKMVHNGIEYGDMQLICEAYDILKIAGGMSNAELADTFNVSAST